MIVGCDGARVSVLSCVCVCAFRVRVCVSSECVCGKRALSSSVDQAGFRATTTRRHERQTATESPFSKPATTSRKSSRQVACLHASCFLVGDDDDSGARQSETRAAARIARSLLRERLKLCESERKRARARKISHGLLIANHCTGSFRTQIKLKTTQFLTTSALINPQSVTNLSKQA